MANQYDEDDDDLDVVEEQQDSPANLRKALKRAEREKKELAEKTAEVERMRKILRYIFVRSRRLSRLRKE